MDLWILVHSSLHKYPLTNRDDEIITIGNSVHDTICIQSIQLSPGALSLQKGKNEWLVFQGDECIGDLHISQPSTFKVNSDTIELVLMKMENQRNYYIGGKKEVSFSNNQGDVILSSSHHRHPYSFSFVKQEKKWSVVVDKNQTLFVNGKRIKTTQQLNHGDFLFFPYATITLLDDDLIQICTDEDQQTTLAETALPFSKMKSRYPLFQRTPRLIYEAPKEKVAISFPTQDSENDQKGLWLILLPPVVMLLVVGMIAILNPRGIFMLISIVMFSMTIFTSTIQYFRDKKKHKRRSEKRLKVYTRYLESKREELDDLYQKQKQVAYYHYPSFEAMKDFVIQISDRIWERTFYDEDFLRVRIGRADVRSTYDINSNGNDLANREMDHLIEQSQLLHAKYSTVKNVPLPVNVSFGSIGLVGKQSIVMRELQQLVCQLAFFHSYHDVRFVMIFDEAEYENVEWLKWLPHFQLPYSYAKGFIYDEKTRDQLLTSLYQIIRERELDVEHEKKRFSPHYIFLVSNRRLIAEHVIMEYLEGAKTTLGFSTIFVTDAKENITENVHTLVQYINEQEGEILIENKKAVHTAFYLDHHVQKGNEEFARTLGSLEHQVGMQNSIPDMVSFLQLLQVKKIDDLHIERNWAEQQSSKSLAVPIGLKGKNDVVMLNLHEKAHGPHGLVAGTTGSGKSEMLQTYILSLAVHFHPHEVAFLLIDYKGGGMAQPFKNMPHLLGTITNIEGSKNFSSRALASINSELKKRQRLFNEYNVNHIDAYMKLYKEKQAVVPMPHLFLICDEFAELKSVEPEFISELVSAARIGRSLGVHLILATQKPGGVIDQQIWSNARFKIALKVQDESDSREILKNTDAAHITTTGRGYLQVGNNEVYELFQSAWSGAPYITEASEVEDEIAFITDLGLVQISDVHDTAEHKQEKVSEINLVVQRILQVQEELQIKAVDSPWLPPLPNRLYRSDAMHKKNGEMIFPIGLQDEPEQQSQLAYEYTWIKDGSVIIFGSSGYGKSTTAINLITQFTNAFNPEQLHLYIFDFGSGSLLPLKQLPHTADYFRMDEDRKLGKFFTFMKNEMDRRKQLFIQKEVSNISIYNAVNEKKLPIIFLIVDNYDLVKEEMNEYENVFTQFSRDGQSLGIYFILTATRVNAVRQPLLNNFKTKIFHYLMDATELLSVIGRTPFEQEAIPGRAIIKKEQVAFVQTYLPVEGHNDVEMLEKLQDHIYSLKEKYSQYNQPSPIPMLPATLSMKAFRQNYVRNEKASSILIGLCEEQVVPVEISFVKNPHLLIVGQFRKGKTNSLKVILNRLVEDADVLVGLYDNVDRGLLSFAEYENVEYMNAKEDIQQWLDTVESMMRDREAIYSECIRNNQELPIFPKIFLVVDHFARFQQNADASIQDRLAKCMKEGSYLGFSVIVAGNAPDLTKGYDAFTTELKQVRQALLLMKKAEQNLFTLTFQRNEPEIQPGYGYFVENGMERFIQIPHYTIERGEKIEQQVY